MSSSSHPSTTLPSLCSKSKDRWQNSYNVEREITWRHVENAVLWLEDTCSVTGVEVRVLTWCNQATWAPQQRWYEACRRIGVFALLTRVCDCVCWYGSRANTNLLRLHSSAVPSEFDINFNLENLLIAKNIENTARVICYPSILIYHSMLALNQEYYEEIKAVFKHNVNSIWKWWMILWLNLDKLSAYVQMTFANFQIFSWLATYRIS
jgi:hypothetical protein